MKPIYKTGRASGVHSSLTRPGGFGRPFVAVRVPREGDPPPTSASNESGELTGANGKGLVRPKKLSHTSTTLSDLSGGMASSDRDATRRKPKKSRIKESAESHQSPTDDDGDTTWVTDVGLVSRRKCSARTSDKPASKDHSKGFFSKELSDQTPSLTSPSGPSFRQPIFISSDNDDSTASANRLNPRNFGKPFVPAFPTKKPTRKSTSPPRKRTPTRIPESSSGDESPSLATRDIESPAKSSWLPKIPCTPGTPSLSAEPTSRSSSSSTSSSLPILSMKSHAKKNSPRPPDRTRMPERSSSDERIPESSSSDASPSLATRHIESSAKPSWLPTITCMPGTPSLSVEPTSRSSSSPSSSASSSLPILSLKSHVKKKSRRIPDRTRIPGRSSSDERIPESSSSDESSSLATRHIESSAKPSWLPTIPCMPGTPSLSVEPTSRSSSSPNSSASSSLPILSLKSHVKKKSPRITDLATRIQSDMTTCGITSSQNSICAQKKRSNHREQWERIVPANLHLEPPQVFVNPESLCPFCDERLPSKPSKKLLDLLDLLKREAGKNRRTDSKNPFALKLPFPTHASCCQLHKAEKDLIPNGIKKGWPRTIDFDDIPRRIETYRRRLDGVRRGEICSTFLDMALKESAKHGPRKLRSIHSEWGSFHVEQPGYYGHKGYEIIYLALHHLFLSGPQEKITARCAAPLPTEFFLRRVLVPETALCLIAEDLNLPADNRQVRKTLEDSRAYGVALFPDEEVPMAGVDDEAGEQEHKHPKRKRKSSSSDIEFVNHVKPTCSQHSAKRKHAAGHGSLTNGSHAKTSSSKHVDQRTKAASQAGQRDRQALTPRKYNVERNIDFTGSQHGAKSNRAAGHGSFTNDSHPKPSSSAHVHHQMSGTSRAGHQGRRDLTRPKDGWKRNLD